MSLQAKLDAFKAEFQSGGPPYNVPFSVIERLKRATEEMVASGMAKRALKAGDKAPAFTLPDPDGKPVSSTQLLGLGPLVLSFYRGVWCPYCNMEMQALEAALPQIRALGATLVAISPQLPANSRRSQQQNSLSFPILSDAGNAVAESFGLRFRISDDLIQIHKTFKSELPMVNGDDSWTLPMPGRFVIAQDETIVHAEVNPDYTRRPDPEDLLPSLRQASTVAA